MRQECVSLLSIGFVSIVVILQNLVTFREKTTSSTRRIQDSEFQVGIPELFIQKKKLGKQVSVMPACEVLAKLLLFLGGCKHFIDGAE